MNNLKVELLDSRPGKRSLLVSGAAAWKAFKNESGKHCIQRIPDNQRRAKPQTSIVAVAITPMIRREEIRLDWKDIEESIQNGSGPGGQKRNRTLSCVQLKHNPSGLIVRIDTERSQHQNRAMAVAVLASRLQALQDAETQTAQSQSRQEQMRGGTRSGKMRTYNFIKGRITDHNLNRTTQAVDEFMKGNLHNLLT